MTNPTADRAPRDALAAELARVADRLRTFSLERLDAPGPTDLSSLAPTRRRLAYDAAQSLADLAARSCDRPQRRLPWLAVHAVADQVVVTGQDLLNEGDDEVLAEAVHLLAALRAAL